MAAHRKSFFEKLAYIFVPADAKGIGFFDRLVLAMQGTEDAWLARPEDAKEKQMLDTLAVLSAGYGIATPKLIIYQSGIPNARGLSNIMVSTRLMEIMTSGQMAAILGHELSHYLHHARDMPVLFGIPVAYGAVRTALGGKPWQYATDAKSKVVFAATEAAGFGAGVLLPRAWSRACEFEADADAAKATSPEQMIGALEILEKDFARMLRQRDEAIRKAGGTPPPRRPPNLREVWETTHPSDELRKNVLRKMITARERGQQVFSSEYSR